MRRVSVFTISLAAFAGAAMGQANGQSLSEALALAYKTNPTLEAQRARLRSVDEGVPQALSGWRPDVKFSSDLAGLVRRTNNIGGFGGGDDERYNYSGRLTVTQNLYQGGQTEAAVRKAQHEISAERARLKNTEQNVLLQAVIAYMDVFREEAVLKLNIGNERVLLRQLQATRDRFNVGEVTRTDVAQAESRLARATAVRIQAEGDLVVNRAIYEQIIGAKPTAVPRPDYPPSLPGSEEEAVALAREGNPAVISAKFDERAARQNIDSVQGELMPSVDLVGQASRSRNQGSPDRTINDLTLTAELTVPLYQQGGVSSRIREAKQLANQSRLLTEEARRAAIEDAASGFEQLVTTRASIKSREAEVRSTKIALEGVEQEAAVGSRTVLDVLDAEQELLDSQVSLVRDQRDAIVASYRLLAAVGRLAAEDLALPVKLYDQKAYYRQVRDRLWGFDIAPGKK